MDPASSPTASLSHRTHSLLWKEWRARWIQFFLFIALYLVPAALFWIADDLRLFYLPLNSRDYRGLYWMGYALAFLALGLGLMSREEMSASTCWLYALPISRSRIVMRKLLALAGLALLMGIPALLLGEWIGTDEDDLIFPALAALPLLLLGAICAQHFGRSLSGWIMAALVAAPVLFLARHDTEGIRIVNLGIRLWNLPTDRIPASDFWRHFATVWGGALFKSFILTLLLAVWGVVLIGRTRIQELPPLARFALGFLFAAVLFEVAYTLYRGDVRDVVLILAGG
jgi:hypothetical protein